MQLDTNPFFLKIQKRYNNVDSLTRRGKSRAGYDEFMETFERMAYARI